MAENRPSMTHKRILAALPAVIFILSLILSWTTAYHFSENLLDSDASSEMVLAKLLSESNSILSTDWIYSNELRVINTNLIFAPLFKILTDWHMVRFASIIILQLLYLLSYRFLCKQLKVSNRSFFLTASLLILPYSIAYGRIVLYHNHYLSTVALGFTLTALYLSVLSKWGVKEKKGSFIVLSICLMIGSALAGLNGVRSLVVTMAPLLVTSVIRLLQTEKQPLAIQQNNPLVKWSGVIIALGMCMASMIGYLINSRVFQQIYSFRSYDSSAFGFIDADQFFSAVLAYLSQFGFQISRSLFSIGGITAMCGLFVALYMAAQGISTVCSNDKTIEIHSNTRFVGALFTASISIMILSFFLELGDKYYVLYLIPVAVMAIPFIAVLIDQQSPRQYPARCVLLGFVIIALFANGIYSCAFFLNPKDVDGIYDGLGRQETSIVEDMSAVTTFLADEGYTLGYASYWNGNIITEMSDGQIGMINVTIDKANPNVEYYDWLTVKHYREEEYLENQSVFLLLTYRENDAVVQTPLLDYATMVYQDDMFIVYNFDFPTSVYDVIDY